MAEDTEKVHPLVSELLEQAAFVPRIPDDVHRYDRNEMMRLRTVPLSVTRPDILSTDFDGDDGKFSPFKWLEHRWEVEGIKNRPANKKLQDALRADCDETAGLSPQRRGFSSGCRAPPDEKKEKDVHPLSVKEEGWNTIDNTKALFAAASSKWRAASTSSMEAKFSSTKGNDFKLPFQKTTAAAVDKTGRPTTWKTVEGKERQNGSFSATGKFIPARSYRGCDERGEKLPEWADDPTTIDDMIELKGFEEPTRGKKKTAAKTVEPAKPKITTREGSQSGSRPSSRNQASESDIHGDEMPMALPDTDAELAAILGLSNFPSVSKIPTAPHSTSQAGSGLVGSRMSKFFSRNPGSEESAKENVQQEPMSMAGEIASNPTLSKLFSHSSTGSVSPQTVQRNAQGLRPMRLEDLERTYMPQMTDNGGSGGDVSKFFQPRQSTDGGKGGSVLQDPQAQAQLLQKLHRVARQQEEGADSPPLHRPAQPAGLPPGYPMPGVMPQLPPEHIIAAQATHLLNLQLQQVYPGGLHQLPPHQLERMHKDMMRNVVARHQQIQALVSANLQQQAVQQAKMQAAPRPAMIPASVQRHMNRSSAPQLGAGGGIEKMEKERDGEEELRQAEALKKQQMQQQYTTLMSAMQNGLSLATVRPGAVAPPAAAVGQPAPPPQMQQLMAQAQAQHMQRVAYIQKHQQHQALMKLMAYQQQQQMQHHGSLDGDRRAASNGNSDPLVGSIQTPLEKLLTAAGVQPSQFTGSSDSPSRTNGAPGIRPMSLEEIERNIPNGAPPGARPMSLQELERQLTENPSNVA